MQTFLSPSARSLGTLLVIRNNIYSGYPIKFKILPRSLNLVYSYGISAAHILASTYFLCYKAYKWPSSTYHVYKQPIELVFRYVCCCFLPFMHHLLSPCQLFKKLYVYWYFTITHFRLPHYTRCVYLVVWVKKRAFISSEENTLR